MGGQSVRIFKHFAVGRMGWCNPSGWLWRLRVRSVWWPKCKDFQAFCSEKDGLVQSWWSVAAALGQVNMCCQNSKISKHSEFFCASWLSPGASWARRGASWGPRWGGGNNGEGPRRCSPQLAIFGGVGGLSCVLGGYSGASGGLFGAPGGLLGGLLRRLGASWGHLGAS